MRYDFEADTTQHMDENVPKAVRRHGERGRTQAITASLRCVPILQGSSPERATSMWSDQWGTGQGAGRRRALSEVLDRYRLDCVRGREPQDQAVEIQLGFETSPNGLFTPEAVRLPFEQQQRKPQPLSA